MCLLFGLVSMLILAAGSCTECKKVDVIAGGNAVLPFTTSGLTIFYEAECKNRTNSTNIGQYCGLNDSCSTISRRPEVSIEAGHLIVYKVIYNRCFGAKTIQGENTCYNVTVNKLHSTISTETQEKNSKFSTETPDYNSTSDNSFNNTEKSSETTKIYIVAVAAVVGVVIVPVIIIYQHKYKQRYAPVNANVAPVMLAKVPHEDAITGKPEAANSTLDGCSTSNYALY